MPDWFAVERLDGDTYAISEYGHWEEPHCYLLLGSERAALIDTGLGVANIREVVDGLTALPVRVLTTHAHWDHIGGHGHFEDIAIHELEADWLNGRFPLPMEAVRANLMREPRALPEGFSIDDYRIYQGGPRLRLRDNDRIDLGGRQCRLPPAAATKRRTSGPIDSRPGSPAFLLRLVPLCKARPLAP